MDAVTALVAALVVLAGCKNVPDLVREERAPGESLSPAEQFRIMQTGKFYNSDYFVDRGQVTDGIEVFGPDREQEKRSSELQERVSRLEQQAQGQPLSPAPQAQTQETQTPAAKPTAASDAKNPVSKPATRTASEPVKSAPIAAPVPTMVAPTAGTQAAPAAEPVAVKARLKLLKELRDEKLISEDEYQAKVKEILNKL